MLSSGFGNVLLEEGIRHIFVTFRISKSTLYRILSCPARVYRFRLKMNMVTIYASEAQMGVKHLSKNIKALCVIHSALMLHHVTVETFFVETSCCEMRVVDTSAIIP
jgi:hypothetical protein